MESEPEIVIELCFIVSNTTKDMDVKDYAQFDGILAQAELLKPEILSELLGAVRTLTEDTTQWRRRRGGRGGERPPLFRKGGHRPLTFKDT